MKYFLKIYNKQTKLWKSGSIIYESAEQAAKKAHDLKELDLADNIYVAIFEIETYRKLSTILKRENDKRTNKTKRNN